MERRRAGRSRSPCDRPGRAGGARGAGQSGADAGRGLGARCGVCERITVRRIGMHRCIVPVALAALACGNGDTVSGQTPAGLVPQEIAGRTLYLRPGFHVSVFAENLGGVRNLVLGPGAAVYAALQSPGKVVKLVDANADGVAEPVVDVA